MKHLPLEEAAAKIAELLEEARQGEEFLLTVEDRPVVKISGLRVEVQAQPPESIPLGEEPCFGMWADREDMDDSTAWVRQLRAQKWRR